MRALSSSLIITALATGCAVGPDYVRPEISTPPTFADLKEAGGASDPISESWWKNFSDDQLQKLIADSVGGNLDLERSVARINQARALRQESFLALFPIVTGNGDYLKSHRLRVGVFGGGGTGGPGVPVSTGGSGLDSQSTDLTFDAVWELDFFGRIRRNVESRTAQTEASIADLQDAVRILVAEIARNYFQLRGFQAQIAVARENAKTQEEVVRVAEALFKGGQSTEFDVVRSKAQLYSTLALIPTMEANSKAAMYRIAVLTGRQPMELVEQLQVAKPIPQYNGPIALGDPASVIRRRPDLRAAERNLASATAQIGVAEGDYFPKVTFTGSFGYQDQDIHNFGAANGEIWSFGPRISWAAFDMGRVYARVTASQAVAAEALATYEQSVLVALEDVQGTLARFTAARQRRDYLKKSVEESSKAVQISRTQYENGLIDLLPVLDAQRALLLAQDQLAVSETDLVTSLVAVFKALGGGWEAVEVKGMPAPSPSTNAPTEAPKTS